MDLYHVLNRGVDKRKIFLDEREHLRFIHDLYEFNDKNWVINNFRTFGQLNDLASPTEHAEKKKRQLLVNIHAFCLMPNHYHLLLSPRVKDGIPRFMRKLNMGYAKYFNLKHKRSGALFEGRYKSILVKDEAHFIHLPYYIHLNPLDLITPEWRNRTIHNSQKAIDFLENYRWSSFLDYTGRKNFPSVTYRNLILSSTGGSKQYYKETLDWIREMDWENLRSVTLE